VLYRPEAFERLTNESWDERRVRDAIREIVADAEASFDPVTLWPAHEWDSWHTPVPLKGLYVGAAGVIFALDLLRRRGLAETRIDLPCAAERALGAWRDAPDFIAGLQLPTPAAAGLFSGESGILVVAWRLSGAAGLADKLLTHVRQNAENPANEVMWGAPGTMLAALAMLDWTGDERWADAWRESADVLWARRQADGLWIQDLHGESFAELGPPHGVVGNALAMLSAGGLLEPERRTALERDTDAALARTAVVEDGLANWPFAQGKPLESSDGQIRLQWCAGAPGIVASAASYLDEELLLAGAELVWRAGPHGDEKGPGLCHGTAGSGHALLKVFERTGDERWLERARRFAMHALAQVKRRDSRYSLWTGDVGVALYASDCIEGRGRLPVLESWE
jgi:Lanthionine synthetase C-like protein